MPGLPRKSTAKQFKKLMKSSGKARTNKSSGASDPSTKKIATYEQYWALKEGLFSFFKSTTINDILEKMEEINKIEKEVIDMMYNHRDELLNPNLNLDNNGGFTRVKIINKMMFSYLIGKDSILDMFLEVAKNKHLTQEKLNILVHLWKVFESKSPLFIYLSNRRVSKMMIDEFIKGANEFLKLLNNLKNRFNIDMKTDDKYEIQFNNEICYPSRVSNNRHFNEIDPFGEEEWA